MNFNKTVVAIRAVNGVAVLMPIRRVNTGMANRTSPNPSAERMKDEGGEKRY